MNFRFYHFRNDEASAKAGTHDSRFEVKLNESIDRAHKMNQINLLRQRGNKGVDSINLKSIHNFTVCVIEDENRNEIARGYAFCSNKDQFSKKFGRMVAKGRAMAMNTTSA